MPSVRILADKTVDETLLMTSRLMKEGNAETARLVKEALDFKRVAANTRTQKSQLGQIDSTTR